MSIFDIVIYFLGAAFIFWAGALLFAYQRTRHYGVLLIGITFGAAGMLAIVLVHWWPLVAGFALGWLLRLLGLDPVAPRDDKGPKAK